ncbi:hypothetical protein [Photobacterium sp. 53610]|uniref:hypothetical protein n=1 Tax=Photobacterium sp. 53610 TaxID=3102789 RepID=UPI002EDB850C
MSETQEHRTIVEISDEQVKAMKAQLKDAPVLFEWTAIVTIDKFRQGFYIMISVLFGGIFFAASYEPGSYWFLPKLLLCFGLGWGWWIFLKNFACSPWVYHYQLTALGIRYTQLEDIPESAYSAVRKLARVGIVVCILSVFILGPFAFVGAGGMALMAFNFTGFEKKKEEFSILFYEKGKVAVDPTKKWISVGADVSAFAFYQEMNCNPEEADVVLAAILEFADGYQQVDDIFS